MALSEIFKGPLSDLSDLRQFATERILTLIWVGFLAVRFEVETR